MSRLALAVLFLLALAAAPASAQRRKRPKAKVAALKVDEPAFNQQFLALAEEAGRGYLTKDPMPEAGVLDQMIPHLTGAAQARARQKTSRLKELMSGAECVQRGQNGMPADVYALMVSHVADGLEVGYFVEADFAPDRRAGRSLDAGEKALSRKCQAEARDAPAPRFVTYQQCLGRYRAAEAYPADPNAPVDVARLQADAGCLRVVEEADAARRRTTDGQGDALTAGLQTVRQRFMSGVVSPVDGAPLAAPTPQMSPVPQGQSLGLLQQRAPQRFTRLEPRRSDLETSVPEFENLDWETSQRMAQTQLNTQIGITGACYSYVKATLDALGIAKNSEIDWSETNPSAKLFAEFVDHHQALRNRRLRRIPNPRWPLPVGALVVWQAGACGYNAEHGHIELITKVKPPEACSDHCGEFKWACFDELGAAAERAAGQVPAAEAKLAAAVERFTTLKRAWQAATGRAKPLAYRSYVTALAELKAVREEHAKVAPRVAAYVVERPATAVVAAAQ